MPANSRWDLIRGLKGYAGKIMPIAGHQGQLDEYSLLPAEQFLTRLATETRFAFC